MEEVPYHAITNLDIGERRQTEIASLEGAYIAATLGLGFAALSAVEQEGTHVKTLKVKTKENAYEIWVPEATKWADRIRKRMTMSIKKVPVGTIQSTKFCRFCGKKIPRDSKYCEECGEKLA